MAIACNSFRLMVPSCCEIWRRSDIKRNEKERDCLFWRTVSTQRKINVQHVYVQQFPKEEPMVSQMCSDEHGPRTQIPRSEERIGRNSESQVQYQDQRSV